MIIRKSFGKLRHLMMKILDPVKWYLQAKYIRLISSKSQISYIDTGKKYVILAPHSDDEWIGCSQIIVNCPNTIVCNMDMQGGDSEQMHKLRFEEMKSIAMRFHRTIVSLNVNKTESLNSLIEMEMPDFILVPHFIDWHPEHQEVMRTLKHVISHSIYKGGVLTYQVSVPFSNRNQCLCSPMSKHIQLLKWKIFKEHYKTQSFMPIVRFKANEYINGADTSSYAAEVYKKYDAKKWIELIEYYETRRNLILGLKSHINNLLEIRRLTNHI